jgi:hypothetical protein
MEQEFAELGFVVLNAHCDIENYLQGRLEEFH